MHRKGSCSEQSLDLLAVSQKEEEEPTKGAGKEPPKGEGDLQEGGVLAGGADSVPAGRSRPL